MNCTVPRTRIEPPRTPNASNASDTSKHWTGERRYAGLFRFACAITILNVLGHLWLGFEQSWATPIVALLAAYATELLGVSVLAFTQGHRPSFLSGFEETVKLLLSAHVSGLAVAMLLYANERLWVVAFAASAAIASKYLFRGAVTDRAGIPRGTRHYLNPSNIGITVTLLLFPWVGIAQPYQFTENVYGIWNWILPGIVICTGTLLNAKFTGRLPLIGSWLLAFAAQALLRAWINDTPTLAGLVPMTGFAFILFTFYMVTDPATTPERTLHQILFGTAVALAYGILMQLHIVFGLFFGLTAVCVLRGMLILLSTNITARSTSPEQKARQ